MFDNNFQNNLNKLKVWLSTSKNKIYGMCFVQRINEIATFKVFKKKHNTIKWDFYFKMIMFKRLVILTKVTLHIFSSLKNFLVKK